MNVTTPPTEARQESDLTSRREICLKFHHNLHFTRGALDTANPLFASAMADAGGRPVRMALVIDEGVMTAWPGLDGAFHKYIAHFPQSFPCVGSPLVIPGGETCKNGTAALEAILRHIHDQRLCRQSMLVAIGGGALLDVAGFAAATAHRGIRLTRLPTTTVSQADSCVGVKNGINCFGKKNYLGTFAVPSLVLCDELLLTTLGERDWRAGFSEAVKVALVRDAEFFRQIRASAPAIRNRDLKAASPIIRTSAELHFNHIALGGDPFELTSARPLDYGHWAAHKLEQLTGFEVNHGEAVAIGVAIDTIISRLLGHLSDAELETVLDCLESLGFTLWHEALQDADTLRRGVEEFREHLGGKLTLSMLDGIGRERLIHELDPGILSNALRSLRERSRPIASNT